MSGQYSGLQARIKAICPYAYFVHCTTHRLNLIIVDTYTKKCSSKKFVGTVGQQYIFIEGSTKKQGLFQDTLQTESNDD